MALPSSTPSFCPRRNKTKRGPSFHCTHRRLTRLYDQHDRQRCTVCHKIPDFGYLYRCTQETDGNLPTSDFVHDTVAMDLGNLQVDDQAPASYAVRDPYMVSPSNSSPHTFCIDAKLISHDVMDTEVDIDENLQRACDGKRKFEIAFPPDPTHIPANCDMKVCHACRPIYKDRAWQSLSYIVNNNPIIPNQYEFGNRRISDATTIVNINYHPVNMHSKEMKHNANCTITKVDHFGAFPRSGQHRQENDRTLSNGITISNSNIGNHRIQFDNDASDADDEKDFGKDEDEDSETTSTDVDIDSAEHSETDDFLSSFRSHIPALHPAFTNPALSRTAFKKRHSKQYYKTFRQ